jgi:uncharacterized protein YndB with AHSA1/START domain
MTNGDYLGREFTIVRQYDAPRDLVWLACTDAKHLAQWWGPHGFTAPVCHWEAVPGNKIYVVMRAPDGTEYRTGGEFIVVVPPEKLITVTGAMDEKGNLRFEVLHTLLLVENRGKTMLTMHSRVIKTTPGACDFLGGIDTGMRMSFERLGDLLSQNELVP